MKDKLLTIGFSTVLVSILMCSIVHADWSTLSSTGYAVTSNWDGQISNTPITVTAGTLDPTVTSVTFEWYAYPQRDDNLLFNETVPIYTNGTIGYWADGTSAEIRYANSTHPIDRRFWTLQVFFNKEGNPKPLSNPVEKPVTSKVFFWIDATGDCYSSFIDNPEEPAPEENSGETKLVVPEIPLGTVSASVAMVAALGLFTIKKKRQQK